MVLFLLVLYGISEAEPRRGDMFMARMRPPMREENICLFLPLENSEGRRLGTCCVFPGGHRRFFGDAVLARLPHTIEKRDDDDSRPSPQRPPSCDIHPLMFRDIRVGVCCTFTGRFHGQPEDTILPEAKEDTTESTVESGSTTESYSSTTIAVPLSFDTRDFINSSCREGYVLDANYDCVKAF